MSFSPTDQNAILARRHNYEVGACAKRTCAVVNRDGISKYPRLDGAIPEIRMRLPRCLYWFTSLLGTHLRVVEIASRPMSPRNDGREDGLQGGDDATHRFRQHIRYRLT